MNSITALAFVLVGSILLGISSLDYKRVTQSLMVEICDNGLDDDADGLIDINDPDCDCPPIIPAGLIPNPSFEV